MAEEKRSDQPLTDKPQMPDIQPSRQDSPPPERSEPRERSQSAPPERRERTERSGGRPRDDRGDQGRDRGGDRRGGGRRPMRRRRGKVCRFCVDSTNYIDYKDLERIRNYITDRGKILPRRITGNCARHQRMLTTAVKRARSIALIPFKVQ